MAQRRMGTSPEGFTHGSEDRLDELTVASQIRARDEMVQLIEKAILEYTNDPAQHKPTVAPKVVKALTDAELKAQVCADFREGPVTGHTCAKANCKRQHIKGVSNCTHPLYLKYGRCPDYYTTCKLLHPFPDSAKATSRARTGLTPQHGCYASTGALTLANGYMSGSWVRYMEGRKLVYVGKTTGHMSWWFKEASRSCTTWNRPTTTLTMVLQCLYMLMILW